MDILTATQHRLLAFISACNRGGHRPDPGDVTAWLESPVPRSPSTFWDKQRTRWDMQITSVASRTLGPLLEPGTGEDSVDQAKRLRWIAGGSALTVTSLGSALLTAAEQSDPTTGGIEVITLDRDDPLAYPRLVGQLAKLGNATLVDPYLRIEQLDDLVRFTEIERILISKQNKGSTERRAAMAVYLASHAVARQVEVRASADNDVHDRLVVSETSVSAIGHSLNGIAARSASTFLIELPTAAAAGQRAKVEQWWQAADPILPHEPPVDPEGLAPEPD